MLSLTINNTLTVGLYDSIKDYPARLQLEAKQYAIMGSSLASTDEELQAKKDRIDLLLYHGQAAEAHLEQHSWNLSKQLMADNFHPLHLEWACHLASVNNVPLASYDEDMLVSLLASMSEQSLKAEHIESSLSEVKERMFDETSRSYPSRVMKGKYNSLLRLKDYGLALVEHYQTGSEESSRKLDEVTLSLLSTQKPANLTNSPENSLVILEKSQFNLNATLQECGCTAPEKLTVYELYGWIERLEAQNERQKAALAQTKPGKR